MAASGTDSSPSPALQAALEAVRQQPTNPRLHFQLGELYLKQQDFGRAADAFADVVKLAPHVAVAHFNLGLARFSAKDYAGAIAAYLEAIRLQPDADSWNNLGTVYATTGEHKAAQEAFESALAYRPDFVKAHLNLGRLFGNLKQGARAAKAFEQAASLDPDNWRVHFNIAEFQIQLHEYESALDAIHAAIELAPEVALLHATEGNICKRLGRITDAVASYVRALHFEPGNPLVYSNLGEVNRARGQLSEAFFCYLEALKIDPLLDQTHSNWLLTMLYDDRADPLVLLQEARRWEQTHAKPNPESSSSVNVSNEGSPGSRLRIGFVSADFCAHPVGHFLLPLLKHLDRNRFETFLYFNGEVKDEVSEALQALSDHWQEVENLSHVQLHQQIQSDRLDVLFDLSGHTGGHRLQVFSMRAAPVQITWAAFPGTTGISQMDYILGDAITLPSSSAEAYAESFLKMPHSHVCFEPPASCPPVSPLPFDQKGYVTFGSCNNYSKLTPVVLRLWAEILRGIPNSRLLLRSPPLHDPGIVQQAKEFMANNGIEAERLELLGRGSRHEYLETYQRIDIALDPFPFGGGITTLESLWMGVPVVCLRGSRFAGLATPSYLTALGLANWIAPSREEYVTLAQTFASDVAGLRDLRATLRERMHHSPLCDAVGFARDFEATLRVALEGSKRIR